MLIGNKRFHFPGALLLVLTLFVFCHHALSTSTPDELNRAQFHSLPVAQSKRLQSTDSDPAKHAYPAVPAIPAALRPTSPSRQKKPPYRVNTIDVGDIALLLYTDASVIAQRLPIHLVTSLLPERIEADNVLIYSNRPDTIGDWRIVDVFENSTTTRTATVPARRKHKHPSQASLSHVLNSDNKFLPLLQHAGWNKPHAKWYIYMEDDSYIFLTNLLHHLSTFSWEQPWYIAPPEMSRRGFFALSRTAWEQVFGAEETEVLQARFASGLLDDLRALDRVLKEDGVMFSSSDGGRSGEPLQAQSHRASAINRENWCAPVYSWHDASSRDISRLHGLELNWHSKRTLQYRDIYTHLIADEMSHGRMDWPLAAGNRHAAEYEITAATADDPAGMPPDVGSTVAWQQGWQSADACETACALWTACVQWSFVGVGDEDRQRCRVDREVVFTFVGDGLQSTSGWMASRIDEWAC
ncbi:hypothetical protein PISL3812_04855 [Talaromyces islandicus]|uniref:Glycosyltransferase family 31 protein n=1 Tax=Talaromyces islandicus TaxID=28573 RepID=A0A0U1LWQ4_TALIS|nr:hypothetical protein PISL3812_04855 [Talaromyces islandicus]